MGNKTNQKQTFTLISLVKTKHEADEFVSKLEDLINAFYNIKTNTQKKIEEILPYDKKEYILKLLEGKKIPISNIEGIQNVLIDLKKSILALPRITIHLAFEPTKASIDTISSWININLNGHSGLGLRARPEGLSRISNGSDSGVASQSSAPQNDDGILIEFVINPTLIAGCALEYNGKYKEYSVKKKLEELYSKGELKL